MASLRTNWLIAIALVGGLLYLLAPVLTPFVAAALLAYIGDPLADRLQKLRMPRTLAVVAVFVLTFLMLALLVLPLYIPVLIFGAGAVEATVSGLGGRSHLMMLGAILLASMVLAPLATAAALRVAED